MAVLDHKKVKIKDVSDGENLFEAPEDERLYTLPEHYQERSPILIELTQSINIDTEAATQIIHLAESPTEQERLDFIKFLKENKINFVWSYADMPGVDPNLIMHNLSIAPRAKLVKLKRRKMNPHVTILVKVELKKLLDVGFI